MKYCGQGCISNTRFTLKSLFRHSTLFTSTSASGEGYGLRYDSAKVLVQRLDRVASTEPLEFSISAPDERLPWVTLTRSGAILAMYDSKVVVYHYL
jgi:hypothetical protein